MHVVSLGLSFSIPKLKMNFINHYFSFENLANTLKRLPLPVQIREDISSIPHKLFREFDQVKRSFAKLPKTLYDALFTSKSEDSIFITRPDKGCGMVVMNKQGYLEAELNGIQIQNL